MRTVEEQLAGLRDATAEIDRLRHDGAISEKVGDQLVPLLDEALGDLEKRALA